MDKLWMGTTLRQVRVLAGISLEEAAAAALKTPGQISHYENGRTVPAPETLARLARCYRMAPEELAAYIDYPIRAGVVRSLRQWYDELKAETLHGHSGPDGHGDGQKPAMTPPGDGQRDTAFGFWHARALGV